MNDYIKWFGAELSFPEDAVQDLCDAYEKVMKSGIAAQFSSVVSDYASGIDPADWKALWAFLSASAPAVGVSEYTLHLLLCVVLSKHLRARYSARGLSHALWKNSMEDLRCKLFECRKMHGVNGTFVASWMPRFFEVTRFGLGRLEFESDKLSRDVVIDGETYPAGTPIVKVHIPSKGKLLPADCLDAFARAVAFYKEWEPSLVLNGKMLFTCHSWLLDPRLAEVLPPTSNILQFAALFTLFDATEAEKNDCMWRIYYKDMDKPHAELPRETVLQAAYADFLMAGNLPGEGYGMRIEHI